MQNKHKALIAIPLVVLSFLGIQKIIETQSTPKITVSECDPSTYKNDATATQFIVPASDTTITRKNFNALTSSEQTVFANAIKVMKALPTNDPTSYAFQARIHNGPIDNTDLTKPFKTCQHAECCFFLAWHRMYIYFFERILRSKMTGTIKPGLPFWDFQNFVTTNGTTAVNGNIPWKFRYPANASTNPLYDNNRSPGFNNYPVCTTFLSNAVSSINFNAAISSTSSTIGSYNYYNFQNAIYNAHGNIHSSIGKWTVGTTSYTGDLGDLTTAANDPLFFLLHANVDRMWEQWLNISTSNKNPSSSCNAYWMNRQFVFYDENGRKVFLKGSDIINSTASKLKYQYDAVTIPIIAVRTCTASTKSNKCPPISPSSIYVESTGNNNTINGSTKNISTFSLSADLKSFLASNPNAAFLYSETDPNADNIYLELESIKPITEPNGTVEVYISTNNMNPSTLTPTNNTFAGLINLFALDTVTMHKAIQRINITQFVKNQGLKLADMQKIQCMLVARGNYLGNIEIPTTAHILIPKIRVAMYKSNQLF